MEQVEQQLDIETLLAGSSGLGRQNEVFDVLSGRGSWLSPLQSEQPWKDFSHLAKPESDRLADKRVDSTNEVPASSGIELQKITVRGDDIGDLPTEYDVNGLEQHELPVIGTYIDPRVCIGFRYRVRNLGTGKYLFQGKGLHLRGIGMGYGKRITFKSEKFNENSNYFYSDTQPDGYGFELVATETGDEFDICDEENCVVGRATVESVDSMLPEIASKVTPTNGAIEKHVPITVTCTITNQVGSHGLMSLQTEETLQVSGVAVVVRERRSALATTIMIQDVTLPTFGVCRLCQPQVPLQL